MSSGNPNELRVVVIGYGNSGRVIHTPLLGATDGYQVCGVVTTSPRAHAAAVADFGGSDVQVWGGFAGLEEASADVAIVATPDENHVEAAAASIAAGLHTVVDKPLAGSVAAALDLSRRADEAGVKLLSFNNRRFDADYLTARKVLLSGQLGRVLRCEIGIARWNPEVGPNWRDAHRPGTLDGGLAGFGSHLVDQAVALFGPVERVYAEVETVRPGALTNDDCFLALAHRSGTHSHILMSSVSSSDRPTWRVQGTNGSFLSYAVDPQQGALFSNDVVGGPGWGQPEPARTETSDGSSVTPLDLGPGDWRLFYRQLRTFLVEDGPSPVPLEQTLHVLRILEASVKSAARRAVVSVS